MGSALPAPSSCASFIRTVAKAGMNLQRYISALAANPAATQCAHSSPVHPFMVQMFDLMFTDASSLPCGSLS